MYDQHDQVSVFNQVLMNVFANYVTNIYMALHVGDAYYMNSRIKNWI